MKEPDPLGAADSLDLVERAMAIEEVLNQIESDTSLSIVQRRALIREIEERFGDGSFGDEPDEALGSPIPNPRPRGPHRQGGAAADPDRSSFE